MLKWDAGGSALGLRLFRHRGYLRRSIAAATGFALAVHLVLSAVVIGHFAPSESGAPSDAFVICHGAGDNSATDHDAPINRQSRQFHCIFCTLTDAACVVLPISSVVAAFDASMRAQHVAPRDTQITGFDSPAGKYARGPPMHA
jgi:hypothetical protein